MVSPGHLSCNLCGDADAELLVAKDGFDIVRCCTCRLVYVANPPDAQELSRHYSFGAGYHTELTADASSMALHEAAAHRNLHTLAALCKPRRLLDVGCSTGLFLKAAQRAGWTVTGVEYSADTADIARRVYGLDVRTGTIHDPVLDGEQFDAITMWDVLEHVRDPKSTLLRAKTLLAPDGVLVIKTPNADGWFPRLSLFVAKVVGFWGHPEPPGHLFQFSRRTIEALLRGAGLRIIHVRYGRIPIAYSFGPPRSWLRSVPWAVYCVLFIPVAWIAPYVGSGDDMVIVSGL